MPARLVLVGAGKMGGALLKGWLARGIRADEICVVEPDEAVARALENAHGVAVARGPGAFDAGAAPEAVILAVKPQAMDVALPAYAPLAGKGVVFLGIAAGRTLASYAKHLGEKSAVVRAMPNTPAAVLRGISVACPNRHVSAAQRALCDELLGAVGAVEWVADEALLDAVTAVSGSGPAYLFHFVECLAEAGMREGLAPDLAMRLARETLVGSGELARQSAESAAALRRNVTSPGGTTEAALEVLMAEDGLKALIARAVAAARRRACELAG